MFETKPVYMPGDGPGTDHDTASVSGLLCSGRLIEFLMPLRCQDGKCDISRGVKGVGGARLLLIDEKPWDVEVGVP